MQTSLTCPTSITSEGADLTQPEVMVVSRTRLRMQALEDFPAGHRWRFKAACSLDQALDFMKERAPSVVLMDLHDDPSGPGGLREWLKGVGTILPVIVAVAEAAIDVDDGLMDAGIFRMVQMRDLQGPGLIRLLDSALEWAERTGRRRPPLASLVMTWGPEGDLMAVSPALATALGWPASEILERRLEDLIAPASMGQPGHWSEAGRQRLQMIRHDGSRWPVSVEHQPVLGADGQTVHVIGVFTDLTEPVHWDHWVQQRAQLVVKKLEAERANQSKSRFMATISHDLRQPMHALGMFVEELRRPADPAQTAGLLEHMARSLASMESLLDSVLALSRLESAQMTPNLQAFELEPMLERLRLNHRTTARLKGLRYSVASSEAVVVSDPVLLERMLSNLVVNALQYTHQGGVLLTCRRRGSGLRLQVWDTGVGIAPEQQHAVFREFYRIEEDNDSRKGVGLGLAIVRSCANLLGLDVALRSEVDRGSCFTIEVPLAAAAEPAAGSGQPARS